MPSRKIVAKLAKDMKSTAKAAYFQHMNRLGIGHQLLVPTIEEMHKRGLTWREISGVLRVVSEELGPSIEEEDDAQA